MIREDILKEVDCKVREILDRRGLFNVDFYITYAEEKPGEHFEIVSSCDRSFIPATVDAMKAKVSERDVKVGDNCRTEDLRLVEFCKACNDFRTFLYSGVEDNEPICDFCGHAKGR